MNTTIENILNRRSTRVFGENKISEENLKEIITAGLYAPSGHNHQPWHFSVINNKEILDKLSIEAKEVAKNLDDEFMSGLGNNEKYHAFYNAQTAILISYDSKYPTSLMDSSLAAQNMMIAAESLDVASCWLQFATLAFEGEKGEVLKKELKIPEGFIPMSFIVFGEKKLKTTKAPERREGTVSYI